MYDHKRACDVFVFHGSEEMQVSDGYHTMDEVYDHRIGLFMALAKLQSGLNLIAKEMGKTSLNDVWRSKQHEEGGDEMHKGWFVMGINKEKGKQINYHLPIALWEETSWAETLDHAPEWDGHTPEEALQRLKNL